MPPSRKVVKIEVQVNAGDSAEQLKRVGDSVNSINNTISDQVGALSRAKAAFIGYFAILKVREIANLSDEFTNVYSRISILSKGTEDAKATFEGLSGVADRTRSSLKDTADVYARIAAATTDTKVSSKFLQDVTETLAQTFRISGASATEATNASIQLGQGLALGVLRGQDLRSVLSQNVEFGRLLAKTFGVTRGEVLSLAEEGFFTASKVLKVLIQNQQEVDDRAKELTKTFQSGLTKAMNDLGIAILGINQKLGLSDGFASLIDAVRDRLGLLGIVMATLAATQIPALLAGLESLLVVLGTLAYTNPITAGIFTVGAALVILFRNITDVKNGFKEFLATLYDYGEYAADLIYILKEIVRYTALIASLGLTKLTPFDIDAATKKYEAYAKALRATQDAVDPVKAGIGNNGGRPDNKASNLKELAGIKDIVEPGKEQKIKEILGAINAEYLKGSITIEQYNQKLNNFDLYKLNRQFKEGKQELAQYNIQLAELRKNEINRYFANGQISVQAYDNAIRRLSLIQLKAKLDAGKISLKEYNKEVLALKENLDLRNAFSVGINAYLDSIGTLGKGIASVIENAFKHLEDTFLDFIKTGKFNFAQFTEEVLSDLERIIIRSYIISPLAKGLLNALPSFASTGADDGSYGLSGPSEVPSAHGNVFDHGLQKFATGGIVTTPTTFGFGNNQRGLMGEAGAEAILPLARNGSGDLGVQASLTPVTINIINNAGADVQQSEKTNADGSKQIDLLIRSKVNEGFASGAFDKSLKTQYGINRRGF